MFDELGWGLEQQLDQSADNISVSHVAASDDGSAIAVWEQGGVAYASHCDGVTWETNPTQLSFDQDGYFGSVGGVGVDVTMDAQGNGIAVFGQATDVANTNIREVHKIHFVAGLGWDYVTRSALSTPDDGPVATSRNCRNCERSGDGPMVDRQYF